ncbi:hypothetical protein Tco_1422585 [Tanacetum coccineum]
MVGMVRGKGHRKRTYEKDIRKYGTIDGNEISFPFVRRFRLMESQIILKAYIKGFQVQRIYVDGGSSSKVMYEHCFRNLGPNTRANLMESRIPLVGFLGEVNYPLRVIDLSETMGEQNKIQTVMMEFVVVKCHCPYNVILGRTGMKSPEAVASTIHSMIKFPTANGVATMAEPSPPPRRNVSLKEGSEGKDEPAESHRENKPLEKVTVNDHHPNQPITIRGNLSMECQAELIKVLRKNADAFAWTLTDITGIP